MIVDAAAREIRGKPGIESRKLDQDRSALQKEITTLFQTPNGMTVTERSVLEIKDYILRLKYAFYEKGINIIGFFIQHGYSHPDISEEVEKAVKTYMSEHRMDLETQDAMILSDLIRYAAADSEEYDFVVGDKNFFKKGQQYIDSIDCVKSKVSFKLLSGST